MKPVPARQTFRKTERLKSSKVIKALFSHGRGFLVHPMKVNWLPANADRPTPARIMIGVSRKNFRNATDRNQLKRLCREAYRKNKYLVNDFLSEHGMACDISIIYIGKASEDYSIIEKKIIAILHRLISELEVYYNKNKNSI